MVSVVSIIAGTAQSADRAIFAAMNMKTGGYADLTKGFVSHPLPSENAGMLQMLNQMQFGGKFETTPDTTLAGVADIKPDVIVVDLPSSKSDRAKLTEVLGALAAQYGDGPFPRIIGTSGNVDGLEEGILEVAKATPAVKKVLSALELVGCSEFERSTKDFIMGDARGKCVTAPVDVQVESPKEKGSAEYPQDTALPGLYDHLNRGKVLPHIP